MTERNGMPTDEMVSSVHTYLASRLGPLLPEDVWVNWTDVARAVLAKYESSMNGTGEDDVPVESSSTRDPERAPVVVVNSCGESVHELELRFSESDHITDEQLIFQLNDTNTTVTFARVCENVYRAPDIELRPGDTLSESAPAAAAYTQGWRDRRSIIQTDVERAAQAVMAAANCDVQVDDADCAHVDDSMPCRCRTKFAYCLEHDGEEPQDPSVTICPWAARFARVALAAAPRDIDAQRGGITDGDLEAITARAEAATPGPWRVWPGTRIEHEAAVETAWSHDERGGDTELVADCCPIADATFIAHAREDVPALVAALLDANARTARAEAKLREQQVSADGLDVSTSTDRTGDKTRGILSPDRTEGV